MSNLPCGLNGALYFISMDQDGGKSRFPNNKAGAKFGTGYCDAQCPKDIKFINGEVRHLYLLFCFGSPSESSILGKRFRVDWLSHRSQRGNRKIWYLLYGDGCLGG
jgi:hypothetical protein